MSLVTINRHSLKDVSLTNADRWMKADDRLQNQKHFLSAHARFFIYDFLPKSGNILQFQMLIAGRTINEDQRMKFHQSIDMSSFQSAADVDDVKPVKHRALFLQISVNKSLLMSSDVFL
jgi:hypothetical protein